MVVGVKGRFLASLNEDPAKRNVYADKSSLILQWLLLEGINRENLSLREVAKDVGVSLGLVQRVFNVLVSKGFLQVEGIRTAKKFIFNKPKKLLEDWLEHYSIVEKCKMRTYASTFSGKEKLLEAIKQSGLEKSVILALHSSAETHGYKNTNLEGLELYILDASIRTKLEKALQLVPQERGYEVLLIEPYYKAILKQSVRKDRASPILLTFLDLYQFPLRGREVAEYLIQRVPEIKRIYKKK